MVGSLEGRALKAGGKINTHRRVEVQFSLVLKIEEGSNIENKFAIIFSAFVYWWFYFVWSRGAVLLV